MPLIRKKPAGHTSRGTIEAYHFQLLRHRKKIVRLNTLIPDAETLSNPRYVNVEDCFDIPRRSIKIHDCRVIVGEDVYLVTGYWYRYSSINRSVKTATGLTWRGELVVTKAGRFIPYLKRVSNPHQADVAAMKFIIKYKLCLDLKKRFPTMIVA